MTTLTPGPKLTNNSGLPVTGEESDRPALSDAAKRALSEADERRRKVGAMPTDVSQNEIGGRKGPDPIRYGDWEKGGIASDF